MNTQSDYILWLPSWYPNRYDSYNGDFIQRHAMATALYGTITVIHFAALGESVDLNESEITVNESGNLKEIILYNKFKPTGIKLLDKLVYNLQYYKSSKQFIADYFAKHGLPKMVHVHVPIKAGNIARWIKKIYGIMYIVSEHASYYMPDAENSYYKRHYLYKRQVAKVFQKAILVTNVSTAIGIKLKQIFGLKSIVTIYNTVNTAYFNYSDAKNDIFTFIHVSTLTDQKNIIGILKTFVQLLNIRKDWKLQLVGPNSKRLHSFIFENGLERHIELIGEVPYRDVAMYMKKAHVLVMFSRHENFPCVIVEALCSGLLVVSSDIAGIPEAINLSNGILIPSENEDELLRAIIHIKETYRRNNHEAIAMAAANLYSYETIGSQIFNLYDIDSDSVG